MNTWNQIKHSHTHVPIFWKVEMGIII